MDNLFLVRTLTGAVNKLRTPGMKIYDRIFRGKEHMEPTDRLAFDVISGSERVLNNLKVTAAAEVTAKTERKTITLTAPRLAQKRIIHTAEMNAVRAWGQQQQVEQMQYRIGRELQDMRNEIDRTIEYWAANALKGVIYDADGTTELVKYGVATAHTTGADLSGTALWDNASSNPVNSLRAFRKLIEDDSGAAITSCVAFVGSEVMDALLAHSGVQNLLKYSIGRNIAEDGRIARLADTEIIEYNGSYLTAAGTRTRFIEADHMLMVGECADLVDVPYAPVVDSDAPGGVGNSGSGEMFFSKSWAEQDPSGRWIKVESRPLPVLQRPECVIYTQVVS